MNIAVWGAGKFGRFVIRQLINKPEITVMCVIDRRADELKEVYGIPIVRQEQFKADFAESVETVLVAFMGSIANVKDLKLAGITNLGIIPDLVYRYGVMLSNSILKDRRIIWSETIDEDLPVLPILETNVVDYCNLNCKGCSHFSNIFPKGSEVAFDNFEKDIQYLSKKINIIQFNLLGGEAFLSSDLEKYISCLGRYMPATVIQLVTNGILIPKQSSERMDFLAQNNVYVSITEYPPVTPLKEKISEILNRHGICFEIRDAVSTFGKNIDVSGRNNPWEAQLTCRESRCHFLRKGRIYKCPFSALGNHFFEYYGMSFHFEEGIDIYNEENNWKEIIDNLDRRPVEQCRLCGVEERFPWEVSVQPEREEWMI